MALTAEEKILRQREYCRKYYQKNKERWKKPKCGNKAWILLEKAENRWKQHHD